MSYDIYLCLNCGWPIYFPFGQKTHIGTGWYCWRAQHASPAPDDIVGPLPPPDVSPAATDPPVRERLARDAEALYHQWLQDRTSARLVPFLRHQLRLGRGDVLTDFLKYLAHEHQHEASALLRELTQTQEWLRYARSLIRSYVPKELGKAPRKRRARKRYLGGSSDR